MLPQSVNFRTHSFFDKLTLFDKVDFRDLFVKLSKYFSSYFPYGRDEAGCPQEVDL